MNKFEIAEKIIEGINKVGENISPATALKKAKAFIGFQEDEIEWLINHYTKQYIKYIKSRREEGEI